MIVSFIISFILIIVCLQDMRTRSIWWFLPILIFVGGCIQYATETLFSSILLNTLFIVVLLGLLSVYVHFRFQQPIRQLTNYFGLGDILFILSITPFVPFPVFVPFFTLITFGCLFIHLLVRIWNNNPTIPFAGYASVIVGIHVWCGHAYIAKMMYVI